MTKSTITDERVTSVIERLEHYACNLKWTNVRGAQDLLTAADGLRELQERRKAAVDSEPVAWTWHYREQWHVTNDKCRAEFVAKDGDVAVLPLYRHAQPAPEKYNIGDATMRHIFTPTGMTNVSDMQAVFDRVEAVLVGMEQPVPVVPDAATAIRACLSEFPESARDIVEECADIAENACRAAMLQELQKSAGAEATCRSNENVQVLHTKSPAQSDCCPAQNGDTPAQSQGWIPVSERMPTKQDGSVFLTWNGQYIGKELFLMGSFQCLKPEIITHWMPLPAPPTEVK
ncbi:DUF551 domain-containing protein [Klebsiella pneumoniae]